jgi:folate-binding protein YgfZ
MGPRLTASPLDFVNDGLILHPTIVESFHAEDAGVGQDGAAKARSSVLALAGDSSRSSAAVLVVGGSDRLSWLNGLVTSDLARRAEGDASYALVVARMGRVIADAIVVADADRLYLVVPAATAEPLRKHLDHYLVMEDAEVALGDGFEAWQLHGPRSADVLRAAREAGAIGGLLDRTGLGGAALVAPPDRASAVREAIAGAVRGAGGAMGDDAAWEALRLERGVPRFGPDFDDKTYPQEAGLEKTAVSFNKGCYLGQEVVCMLELRGHVKRKLAPVVFDSIAVPAAHAEVLDESGASVGEMTSAALSPVLGVAVGLAMVKRSHAEPGAVVVVGGTRAKVVDRPA